CRLRLLASAVQYELMDDALVCHRRVLGETRIPFSHVEEIYVFKERRFGSSRSYWACTIRAGGQRYSLSAAHRLSLLRTEDRTPTYIPFIKEFEKRAISTNPELRFIVDEYGQRLGTRIYGRATLWAVIILSRIPRRAAANICAIIFRRFGVMLRGHRHARRQLVAAFPNLNRREIRQLLHGMWD